MRLLKLLTNLLYLNFLKLKLEKILAGALFRKTYETVTTSDVKNIYNKNIRYTDLSCADSILELLNS